MSRTVDIGLNQEDLRVYGREASARMTGVDLAAMLVKDPKDFLMSQSLASGDLNADGSVDLVFGSPFGAGPSGSRTEAGEVSILFGPFTSGVDVDFNVTDPDVLIYGASGARLGNSIAVGDVNGDRNDDLVVGAYTGGSDGQGMVHVVFGPLVSGSVLDLETSSSDFSVLGGERGDALGQPVAVGDISGDGLADLIVGAAHANDPTKSRRLAGQAYAFFGPLSKGTQVDLGVSDPDVRIVGSAQKDQLGSSLAAADLSGDGSNDLLIGSMSAISRFNYYANDSGRVYVLFGPLSSGLTVDFASQQADVTVYGYDDTYLGDWILTGDVSGDGNLDLFLRSGEAWFSNMEVIGIFGPFVKGTVFDLVVDTPDLIVYSSKSRRYFAASADAADLSGDGVDDLIVGDHTDGDPTYAGTVYVLNGPFPEGSDIDIDLVGADLIVNGADGGDELGASLMVTDVSGNGAADLVLGAPGGAGPTNVRANAGEAYVIFGAPANDDEDEDADQEDPDEIDDEEPESQSRSLRRLRTQTRR